MSDPLYPPPAFAFSVSLLGEVVDAAFQEVSGIDAQVQTEEVAEGGVNAYVHRLPGVAKHSNLVLKRGYVRRDSALADWAGQVVGSALDTPVTTQMLTVSLLGPDGAALVGWTFDQAWPVKWEAAGISGEEMVTEVLEIAYSSVTRTQP